MNVSLSFMLKKMLAVAVMPLSLGVIAIVIALLLIKFNRINGGKKLLKLSILWLVLISWSPFSNLMLKPLESAYPKLENIPDNIEYILLLGGDRDKRAWEALRLYHKIPNVKIITSGYSLHDKLSDANKTAQLLIDSGIPSEKIVMQDEAKTTFEEALWMKKRVGKKPFILITSAYHMPRAYGLFKKAGLNPIPAPTDFNHPQEYGILSMLQSVHLQNTEHAWHEYIGLLVYKIQGKI